MVWSGPVPDDVWHGAVRIRVRCDTVPCSAVWCVVVRCGAVRCGVMLCGAMWCGVVWFGGCGSVQAIPYRCSLNHLTLQFSYKSLTTYCFKYTLQFLHRNT